MFKKIFKAATVFTLLVGCYLGYVQVFALVVRQMTTARRDRAEITLFANHDSNSLLESMKRAKDVMPPGHWGTKRDLNFRYYNAERGYWMYAEELEQVQEENGVRYDGKRIRLSPFLMISTSHDGKKTDIITSDRAIIDLNQPLGFIAGPDDEPLKVKHVRLEPNVVIRDNKGTPNDPKDDMTIGPLTTFEYDEPTQRLTTDSHVVIVDPDMITTGDGMLVQLSTNASPQPGGSSGFGGAEYLELFKNVHVVIHDVGKSGMIAEKKEPTRPKSKAGEAKVQVAARAAKAEESEPKEKLTPLDVTCDSKMRVFLPKTRLQVKLGPPAPPAPTFIQFDRNVVVLRGNADEQPGQITCDTLKLTMVPSEPASTDPKAPAAETASHAPDQQQAAPDAQTAGEKGGLFGSLALERAHATGHAVWLYLPEDGVKLRCNELIHVRRAPYKPDLTYFRGDLTRPLEIEKIDLVQEADSPDRGKVKSITHIRTIDATMYDKGGGFDSADIDASGPGRLDTQPDRGQPVFRTAIWQDKFKLINDVGADGKIKQKIILLTGKRPCFDDKGRKLDAGKSIKVWLVPDKSQAVADASDTEGGFDIRRLLALRDVHLLAPGKNLTARQTFDSYFEQVAPDPVLVAAAPAANAEDAAGPVVADPVQPENQVAAQDEAPVKPEEPLMVGSAERIWVKIEMKPKPPPEKTSASIDGKGIKTASAGKPKSGSTDGDLGDKSSEIREAWLFGSVALHQDPAKGETRGKDASGEALYLDNRGGEGKTITHIYQREPNETTYLPGPLPAAKAANEKKTITAAGIIAMNQATDQIWVEGPGTLTEISTRAASSPAKPADAPPADTGVPIPRSTAPARGSEPRATSLLVQDDVKPGQADQAPEVKPTTRAGRLLSEEVVSTISFTEAMEFNGKSVDPAGRPAGRTDFFGIVTAQLEDSLLHCEERMIAYTDRPVPLAKLGTLANAEKTGGQAAGNEETDDQPQLALIECYKKAIGISRKVDPILPTILQQQRIEADELLVYERLNGEFHIPGKGKVFLYDRSDNSRGQNMTPGADASPSPTTSSRTVTPTSSRNPKASNRQTAARANGNRDEQQAHVPVAPNDAATSELPPLVLTQIHFLKGMRGRLASTNERTVVEPNWYEFFGDIQLGRAKVTDTRRESDLNFDKLPPDGMFLTGQTLRVRTEPPPAGSPPSTPARDLVKVWENARVTSSDKTLEADVITYDSEKDLVFAIAEGGRNVIYAQQYATGQPATQGSAKAVQFNPKTGAAHSVDNTQIQFIDKNGARPVAAKIEDPDYKKKKPPKKGFRIPSSNVERRGFTGQ